MKNLFFVAVGAIIIMLSACGKDATVNSQDQAGVVTSANVNDIIGTWYFTTDTTRFYTSTTLDSTKTALYVGTDNITFNNTGLGTEVRGGNTSSFSYIIANSTISLVFATQPGGTTAVNLLRNTGGRSLATANYTVDAAIKQLSATSLKLVFDSTSGTQSVTETVVFAKQ